MHSRICHFSSLNTVEYDRKFFFHVFSLCNNTWSFFNDLTYMWSHVWSDSEFFTIISAFFFCNRDFYFSLTLTRTKKSLIRISSCQKWVRKVEKKYGIHVNLIRIIRHLGIIGWNSIPTNIRAKSKDVLYVARLIFNLAKIKNSDLKWVSLRHYNKNSNIMSESPYTSQDSKKRCKTSST